MQRLRTMLMAMMLVVTCTLPLSSVCAANDQMVPTLLRVLAERSAYGRIYVATKLGELRAVEAVPVLIPLLQYPDFEVREAAAIALGKIGAVEAVPALIEAMFYDNPFYSPNEAALEAIGEIGIAAAPLLASAWESDAAWVLQAEAYQAMGRIGIDTLPLCLELLLHENPVIRANAAGAMSEIGPAAKEAAPALMRALADDHPVVRSRVAYALGDIGAAEAIPALIAALQDPETVVRRSAARSLGRFGSAAYEAVPALAAVLHEDDRYLLTEAARALGAIGEQVAIAVPDLIAAFDNQYVRSEAQAALVKIGAAAVPYIIEALPRTAAIETLGKIGDARAVPALSALVTTGADYWTILLTAQALARMNVNALPFLLERFHNADAQLQEQVADILAQTISTFDSAYAAALVPDLITLFNRTSGRTRGYIADALGDIGKSTSAAVPGLIAAISDSDASVRVKAVVALGKIGAVEAVPYLMEAYRSDPSRSVRQEAIIALGRIGAADALPVIGAAVQDPYYFIRLFAIKALEGIDAAPEAKVPLLIACFLDEDAEVSYAAMEIISKICDEMAIKALIDALVDSNEVVRVRAAQALYEMGVAAYKQVFFNPESVTEIVFSEVGLHGNETSRILIKGKDGWRYNSNAVDSKRIRQFLEVLQEHCVMDYASEPIDDARGFYPEPDTWRIALHMRDGRMVTFDLGPMLWTYSWLSMPYHEVKVSGMGGKLRISKFVVSDLLRPLYESFRAAGW
ncbi:MAG TPA: HEAT repeat domain-containing protein [Firmicutes bacterium]|nr:HEAT repeat domain-containing protein [Bacillota bacterium]